MLYLCTSKASETAIRLAAGGALVLLQDAVTEAARVPEDMTCYALADDVERRGLAAHFPTNIRRITYAQLVDLILQQPVVNLG